MRKVGILSDDYYYRNCVENMPLRVGLSQQLFPYDRNVLSGVPLPKDLPVAQRGYEMSRVAYSLSQTTGSPYEQVLGMLREESRRIKLEELKNVTTSVKISDTQQSFLAKSIKPRQSNFSQLSRAYISPSGSVMPKTGKLTPEMEEEISFSEPSGDLAPQEDKM
tara:strand:+ start:4083 stop:4574 length:492 start_codon:yes stop_codon:yes gene_type:complete